MELSKLTFNELSVTNTTKFILPFILPSNTYINKAQYDFINAYVGDINRPWLEDKVLLVYKYSDKALLAKSVLTQNSYYYDSYWITINNESYEVLVFNIPPIYKNVTSLIKAGYVTSIDVSSKKKITDFWRRNEYNVYYEVHNIKLQTKMKELTYELIIEEDLTESGIESFLVA